MMALTLMSWARPSDDSARASPNTPAFADTYDAVAVPNTDPDVVSTTRPYPCCDHSLPRGLHDVERADQVRVDHALDRLGRHLTKATTTRDARIRHDNVDATERVDGACGRWRDPPQRR
jgi:hypothetical protein